MNIILRPGGGNKAKGKVVLVRPVKSRHEEGLRVVRYIGSKVSAGRPHLTLEQGW